MLADEMRMIFRAENFETIISVTPYRDRVLIATNARILEWNPGAETISVLEFVLSPDDKPNVVYAYHRTHPYG